MNRIPMAGGELYSFAKKNWHHLPLVASPVTLSDWF